MSSKTLNSERYKFVYEMRIGNGVVSMYKHPIVYLNGITVCYKDEKTGVPTDIQFCDITDEIETWQLVALGNGFATSSFCWNAPENYQESYKDFILSVMAKDMRERIQGFERELERLKFEEEKIISFIEITKKEYKEIYGHECE